MANIAANSIQVTAVQMGGVALAAPAAIVLAPASTGTSQTYAFASFSS